MQDRSPRNSSEENNFPPLNFLLQNSLSYLLRQNSVILLLVLSGLFPSIYLQHCRINKMATHMTRWTTRENGVVSLAWPCADLHSLDMCSVTVEPGHFSVVTRLRDGLVEFESGQKYISLTLFPHSFVFTERPIKWLWGFFQRVKRPEIEAYHWTLSSIKGKEYMELYLYSHITPPFQGHFYVLLTYIFTRLCRQSGCEYN